MTVGELTEWILKNRKGEAFKDYSPSKIVNELTECLDHLTLICVTDPSGIVGVACFRRDSDNRTLYVYDMLTTKRAATRKFIEFARENYPGYTFKGDRRGSLKTFNLNKLAERI